jgi:hypothetical protein
VEARRRPLRAEKVPDCPYTTRSTHAKGAFASKKEGASCPPFVYVSWITPPLPTHPPPPCMSPHSPPKTFLTAAPAQPAST